MMLDKERRMVVKKKKETVDASTAMMKEKSCSRSIHSLIILVARSTWPFMCASRTLFLLAFYCFQCADGRW